MPDRRRRRLERQFGKGNASSVDKGGHRRVRDKGLVGLFSPEGKVVLKPQFDYICHFNVERGAWLAIRKGCCLLIKPVGQSFQIIPLNIWDLLAA